MKTLLIGAVAALLSAGVALAAPLKLTPASPQPGGLKGGLAVAYGYAPAGQHIKQLADARRALQAGAGRCVGWTIAIRHKERTR